MALLILALLQRIFLMSSLMLLLVWLRSEERRVGKECRSRWSPCDLKKKTQSPAPPPPTRRIAAVRCRQAAAAGQLLPLKHPPPPSHRPDHKVRSPGRHAPPPEAAPRTV